jgi:hypothetical protein
MILKSLTAEVAMNRAHKFLVNVTNLLVLAAIVPLTGAHAAEPPVADRGGTNPILAFFAFPTGGSWHSVELATEFTEIQRLTLPAGKYIVNASAQLATVAPGPLSVDCIITINGSRRGELARGVIGGLGQPTALETIALTAGFSITSRRHLGLACRAEHPFLVFSQPSPITAIQVDDLRVRGGLGFD